MKNRFLNIFTLLVFLIGVSCLPVDAQDIYLRLRDGKVNSTVVKVTDGLNMEIQGENFIIQTSESDVRIEMSGLQSFSYETDYSGIESNRLLPKPAVTIGEGYVKISSPEAAEYFYSIYDLTGAIVTEHRFSGETTVDLTEYEKGVYVMNVEKLPAFKFIVK